MTLTDQTKRDLATVLDTLDQRIREVCSTVDQRSDQEAPAGAMIAAEAAELQELRERVSGMLGAD